jgi:hypothetical protein
VPRREWLCIICLVLSCIKWAMRACRHLSLAVAGNNCFICHLGCCTVRCVLLLTILSVLQ